MQGVVFMPENPHQGSPPPNNVLVPGNMEDSLETKESLVNQSNNINNNNNNNNNKSDSGVYSSLGDQSLATATPCDSDVRSDCSSPEERKYVCPICDKTLTSQHDFTLHIRSHNNESGTEDRTPDHATNAHNNNNHHNRGFTCRICRKVLSSSSSLDRHVLVHSGERPFQCKFCGDTFTTNGNMHRHMRKHSHKDYESDGASTDSGSARSVEFNNNNNKIEPGKRKKLEDDEDGQRSPKRLAAEDVAAAAAAPAPASVRCPLCDRSDFTSVATLDAHLEDNHPEYPAKCDRCRQVFQNNRLLGLHKEKAHEMGDKQQQQQQHQTVVQGFDDLTFVDFSSNKFPYIARRECEMNVRRATAGGTLRFQCPRCLKAFPCTNSLEIHRKGCASDAPSAVRRVSEDEIRRAEFFSRLNLQDNSPDKSPVAHKLREQLAKSMDPMVKDLADIQSILSNISVPPAQLHSKAGGGAPETGGDSAKNEHEEESQDFVREFRMMKLRGEFPCRLCSAIFPNLRALKGHNRAHLMGNTNGTYFCNMCPHSSIDKAALIRHMRTHNGDRPYECSICNYAFTTKANCERHLRNRHSKTTREDVKKSIIYHPSEDPTNDELNKLTATKEEKKRASFNSSASDSGDLSPEKAPPTHSSTPKATKPTFFPDLQALKPTAKLFPIDFIRNENLKALNGIAAPFFPTPPFNLSAASEPPATKIHVKPFDSLRDSNSSFNQSEDDYYEEDEEEAPLPPPPPPPPMDVALDLSKKKLDEDVKRQAVEEDEPQDLSRKSASPTDPVVPNFNELFARQLLKTQQQGIDPRAALYATHLAQLYHRFPSWPALNPLLFQAALPRPPSSEPPKERTPRFPWCGSTVNVSPDGNSFKPFQPPSFAAPPTIAAPEIDSKRTIVEDAIAADEERKPPSVVAIDHSPGLRHQPSDMILQQQQQQQQSSSPNSVKMVIKNGVLMPKQKQRRYRTERPFTCEHCSARFTLRSNMERHIKQQHPQYWSQRQRGTVGHPGRKPQGMLLKPNFCGGPMLELPAAKMQDFDEDKEQHHLTEKLRVALMAQQIDRAGNRYGKETIKKEEDEDCELVIDENERAEDEALKTTASQELQQQKVKTEEDLVPVARLLDNASQQQFNEYFKREAEDAEINVVSEEDEEGLVASGSTSDVSGTDEARSESETLINATTPVKKKSAYSLAPNRVSCPYCNRKFPWTSSLRRHVLTHTGQKPFKCSHCPLLFTTKSNCDRHLLRKHGNSATTIVTGGGGGGNEPSSVANNYLMRNVPERPFKCSSCPSSTFSTYTNLKKHINGKHATNAQGDDIKAQGYEAGSSEDEKVPNQADEATPTQPSADWDNGVRFDRFPSNPDLPASGPLNGGSPPTTAVPNADLPFKCHLCESSFAERAHALEHTRDRHASEYDLLMSKNALDVNATTPDHHHDDDDQQQQQPDIRGKFPDYSNRKVVCAWCMRRFWSAEDLRRHMRTHTGERPFSCDICRRRFTLKHSMLRHRKKHALLNGNGGGAGGNFEQDGATHSDDDGNEEQAPPQPPPSKDNERTDDCDAQEAEAGDLIGNLLGIRDKSIIERVLDASPDVAAKMLGVKDGAKE